MSMKQWLPLRSWGIGLLMALVVLGSLWSARAGAQNAQNAQDGEWSASLVKENSNINVNFGLRSAKAGKHQFGQTYEFAELGITREQVLNGGPVRFRLVREAGTIDAEGSFQNGKGSGTFRFTGNASFVSAMKSRGYDFEESPRAHDDWPAQKDRKS